MAVNQRHDFGDSAIIVARVSTPQQTESPQINDLREYAEGLGYMYVVK
jgi:DNA invertase Pin-like site-specific DNA recombinase